MEPGVLAAVLICLVGLLLWALWAERRTRRTAVVRHVLNRKKGLIDMANTALGAHKGKQCKITTMLGEALTGKIVEVTDNWVEVETKKEESVLVNADFIERFQLVG